MKISKIKKAVRLLLSKKGAPVPFIKGFPGIGKSQLVKQIAVKDYDGKMIDCRLSQFMSEDLKGIPKVDLEDRVMRWFAPDMFPLEGSTVFAPDSKGILFFDEINRAMPDVLQAVFQLVLDRCIGEKGLLPGWKIICAGNLGSEDGTNVNDLDSALRNRFAEFTVDVNLGDFMLWANKAGIREEITGYLNQHADKLHVKPDLTSNMDRHITPRSWEFLHNSLEGIEERDELLEAIDLIGVSILDANISAEFRDYVKSTLISGRMILNDYDSYKETLLKMQKDRHLTNRINEGIKQYIIKTPVTEVEDKIFNNLAKYMTEIISHDKDFQLGLVKYCSTKENNTIVFEMTEEEEKLNPADQPCGNNGSLFFDKFFDFNETTIELHKELVKIYEKPVKAEITDKMLKAGPKLLPTLEDLIEKGEITRQNADPFLQTLEEIVEENLENGVIKKVTKYKKLLDDLKARPTV